MSELIIIFKITISSCKFMQLTILAVPQSLYSIVYHLVSHFLKLKCYLI